MALPPTVPSSFVPYSGSRPRRYRADFGGAFGFFAYGVFVLLVAASVGVFVYGRILNGVKSSDDAALAKAEAQLDPNTIDSFIKLQNRLKYGAQLLNSHIALSNLFTQLNSVMPTNVQLKTLSLVADTDGSFKVQASGIAANLNALAQFSDDLGAGKTFQNVIVSGIKVDPKSGADAFTLSANATKSLVAFSAATAQPIVTSSPPSTSSSTARAATTTLP